MAGDTYYASIMLPQWVIEKKRDGQALSEEDIRSFIAGYASGSIPDYQMSALAMAVYFRGMTAEETAVLTDAMMRSGEVMDASSVPLPKSDKHSTGGVGDKVSLILAPLVACCGVAVPMISGRGLGITGGTLDKMESIPGYRTDLSPADFIRAVAACGCSIIGQTARLAPADRKLYALRDVTGTVPSIPLISASIMSKKLAEGIDSLVLDVKWGKGAFMKTLDDARELARSMVAIGTRMDKGMVAVLTDMNQPLGRAVGNAVEVVEAIGTLRGNGPADLLEVTLTLSSHMLVLSRKVDTVEQGIELLNEKIRSGQAFDKFKEMVTVHGGDAGSIDDVTRLPTARIIRTDCIAEEAGYVVRVDAEKVARGCALLGAGRAAVTDSVDHAVGITDLVKEGERVEKGRTLLTLHANDQSKLDSARAMIADAFKLSATQPETRPLVVETIGAQDVTD